MAEYAFLDEKPYEHTMYNYRTLKPAINNDEFIQYDFPEGKYMVDNIIIAIKFEDKVISKKIVDNILTIEHLFKEIIPFYNNNVECTYGMPKIPCEFITAYTEICNLNKNELYFYIPLIKLSSINLGHHTMDPFLYERNAHLMLKKTTCG